MQELAELETQKQIYMLISKEPGLHIGKIAELLDIKVPLAIYHIRYLEKHDLITIVKERGYTRCYLIGMVGIKEKKILSLIRQETPLKIVLYLLKKPHSKHKELLEHFDIAKSTLSYHLKKLMKRGIVDVQLADGEQGYCIINEQEIIKILIKYKPSRVALGVKNTWEDFTIYYKK